MLINYDAANSLAAWLENIRAAQDENGVIPGIVPTGGWGYVNSSNGHSSGPAWDSVCVSVPYYVYKFYGDKKIISDNMQMIMRMLMYQCSAANLFRHIFKTFKVQMSFLLYKLNGNKAVGFYLCFRQL